MKTIIRLTLFMVMVLFIPKPAEAQFLKKLAKHAEDKIKREAERRSERRVDKKIDKEFDDAEDVIDGKKSKKKKDKKGKKKNKKGDNSENVSQNKQNGNSNNEANENQNESVSKGNKNNEIQKPKVVWSKFDFVPGETVIFEDMPSTDEENGEFPSRWDLYDGSAEIVEFDNQNVIMFLNGGGTIVPYLKNPKEDHLPEVFTIEFDVYFTKSRTTANRYFIALYDIKNQRPQDMYTKIVVYPNGIEYGDSNKRYPGTENRGWSSEPTGKWRHISIAYTRGKLKAYMDDTRLINVPHMKGNPTGLSIRGMRGEMYLKNVRIAKGGVKYYDRVLSEGKIIVNGIKFDVNKATLKSESMGPINKIYNMMVKNPDLKFSIEGHTDADGDETHNQTLSEARAKAVMEKMISMGIDASRLKYKGFGESKPIDNNSTPEGKANNRRVEFVKF